MIGGGAGGSKVIPLTEKSLPTSGITFRGRPLNTDTNEGILGNETGRDELLRRGRLGNGFIAWGDVKYETSCKHLYWSHDMLNSDKVA